MFVCVCGRVFAVYRRRPARAQKDGGFPAEDGTAGLCEGNQTLQRTEPVQTGSLSDADVPSEPGSVLCLFVY